MANLLVLLNLFKPDILVCSYIFSIFTAEHDYSKHLAQGVCLTQVTIKDCNGKEPQEQNIQTSVKTFQLLSLWLQHSNVRNSHLMEIGRLGEKADVRLPHRVAVTLAIIDKKTSAVIQSCTYRLLSFRNQNQESVKKLTCLNKLHKRYKSMQRELHTFQVIYECFHL